MNAIPINASTGAYTGTGTPPYQVFNVTNASMHQMVLSPDGANLFLALGRGGTIVVPFTAGNSNPLGSKATVIPLANSNGSALSVAVDPTNRLFYIGETLAVSGHFRRVARLQLQFARREPLTQASGSPIASGGGSPSAILPEASGDYVYVANGQGNTGSGNVAWFPITAFGNHVYGRCGQQYFFGDFALSALPRTAKITLCWRFRAAARPQAAILTWKPTRMSSGALTANIASTTGTDPVGAVAVAALP